MTINNEQKMDRMRRIVGIGKAKVPSAVQKDKDESIVFFRELYKRDKDRDVNLLEPMYSVDFDTIQGGHVSKLPSGKRDFLIPVDEKHDYDWLKTPPATPLFPSIEMEANSSEMVFQKELPIPRPVKPSASRLSGKPEATKTSVKLASPTADPSSKKNFFRGAPAISTEKRQPYTIDKSSGAPAISKEKRQPYTIDKSSGAPAISKEKRQPYTIDKSSTYSALTNRQQKAVAATTAVTTSAVKKHSDRCYASQGSITSAVKRVTSPEVPYKAPKNLLSTGSIFARHVTSTAKARSRDPALCIDAKLESVRTRRQSCPPVAKRGIKELQLDGKQNVLPVKGKAGSEPASSNCGHAGEATLMKGMRRADGRKEQRQKF